MTDSTGPLVDISTVDNDVLKKVVEIRCSECYGAMAFANAIAGVGRSDTWDVLHSYSVKDIAAEVNRRQLPVDNWYAAIDEQKRRVVDIPIWQKAMG